MTSRVRVNMKVCGKATEIRVTDAEDGTYGVEVDTDCDHVKEFFEGLEAIDLVDLSDKQNSKVFQRMGEAMMSATCLVPAGLLNAGWLEAGLLSKNLAAECGDNRVEFLD
ncbi:MAG: DUF6951 family protein [Methanomassiliicoccales archaeon]